MIGFAEPRDDYPGTGTIVTSNVYVNGPTATTWLEPPRPYVLVYYDSDAYFGEPTKKVFDGIEPMWRRRWRLSLEAIERYRRAARRLRLRLVSLWRRPVSVRRVCSLAERWRVQA